MAERFRKIYVKMYGDRRFNELSAPRPNAQSLWVFLLTGPHTSSIPGLSTIGETALAESMNWHEDMEGFRKAFAEVSGKGMVTADWKARVVWIPNAVKYNDPENPNVIKGWRKAWDEIPECELKLQALQALAEYVKNKPGENDCRLKAFKEAFPEAFAKPFRNQEQEQEQEQEKYTPQPPKGEVDAEKRHTQASPKGDAFSTGFLRFWSAYPSHERKVGKSECFRIWKRRKLERIAGQVIEALERCKVSHGWTKNGGEFIPGPKPWLNKSPWETDPNDLVPEPSYANNGDPDNFVPHHPDPSELPWNRNGGAE